MINVHLIGYTADLRHIVLDLDPDHPRGHYRLEIDVDLFLTLDEVRERRRAAGMEAGPRVIVVDGNENGDAPGATSRAGEDPVEGEGEGRDHEEHQSGLAGDGREEPALPAPEATVSGGEGEQVGAEPDTDQDTNTLRVAQLETLAAGGEPGEGFTAPDWDANGEPGVKEGGPAQQESRLKPAEIQALLRAGRSPKTVAKLAGINLKRVERWLPPILAERARVLQEAKAIPLDSPSGQSRQTLSAVVARNLAHRGIDPDRASWSANRRVDGRWTVQLRYRDAYRSRCASWTFDRQEQTLTAGNQFAQELAWSDVQGDGKHDEPSLLGRQDVAADVDHEADAGHQPEAVHEGEIV
ncbi:MAG: septation protein SepH [Nitriliruptorales bacterium]